MRPALPYGLCVLPAVFLAAAVLQPPRPSPIEQRIADALRDSKAVCGVAAIDLLTGGQILVNGVESYAEAAEGRIAVSTPLVLRDAGKVVGSGVLEGLHDGLSVRGGNVIHLMIVVSDDTATNLLVARLGTSHIDDRPEAIGLHDTRLFGPAFRDAMQMSCRISNASSGSS